jgi:hypothetical protein
MRREADALLIRKILTQSLLHILRTKFKLSSNSRRGFFSFPKSPLPSAQQFAFGRARITLTSPHIDHSSVRTMRVAAPRRCP